MPITAKTYTTEVICLRAIDFGEADRILHLYSPEYGRISAIAKSAKKPNSKLAGACELLNLSEVQLSKGKNLDVLTQYQPRETYAGIRVNLLKLAYALLFAELVNLTSADADMDSHQLFELLRQALAGLNEIDEAQAVRLAIEFQIRLLDAIGYHPLLDECVFTGETLDLSGLYYCFSPQLGGVTTPERKRARQAELAGFAGPQWVNVSASTLRILGDPHRPDWNDSQLVKAQKFLQFYFKHVIEKHPRAFDLVFSLLEPLITETGGGDARLKNLA